MIGVLLLAFAAATASPAPVAAPAAPAASPASPASLIRDADHAITAGRLEEARLLIGRAVASGATGPSLERVLGDLAYRIDNFQEALNRYKHLAQIAKRILTYARWARSPHFNSVCG